MDFSGFKFNGHHSSSMNFVRTSSGSRYEENLIPTFQDKTVAVPGGDGTYFFDSFYTNRTFTIQIAFDSMTEADLREFRKVFNTKEMGELIFDETPYKAYIAKVQSPPQLKYICFDENKLRKYKGEGTIQFICYEPYAHSIHKFLDQYTTEYSYYNPVTSAPSITGMSVPSIYLPGANQYTYTMDEWLEQWKAGSGMATHSTTYNFGDAGSNINLYNPGDVEADFLAFFPASVVTNSGLRIRIEKDVNEVHGQLYLKPFTVATGDSYICINSKTNLIEGIKGDISLDNRSGNLYNQYILAGDFFKIPMATDTSHLYKFKSHSCTGTAVNNAVNCSKLIYDYLYY